MIPTWIKVQFIFDAAAGLQMNGSAGGGKLEDRGLEKALEYRWLIFVVLAAGYLLVYFHRLCPAVVAEDMMKELKTTGGLIGLLGSAYFYPYALMQIPAGLLSDSWGPRKTIASFFTLACAGSIILGLSGSVTSAVIGRTMVGLGVSMLFVPTMKTLAVWFRAREFSRMTGVMIAMGGVGSLTAYTPLALLNGAVGWRKSFILVGGITAAITALIWLVVRDRPSDMGWTSPVPESPRSEAEKTGLWEGVRVVVTTPRFWPLALWFFFGCSIFFAFAGLWGGPYLMQVFGYSRDGAASVLNMHAFGMIVGSPLLSLISDKVVKGRKPVLVFAAIMTMACAGFLAFKTTEMNSLQLYLLCFTMGVFTNGIVVIGFTSAKELFPVRIAGTSVGLINLFPFLGGAILQPLLGHVLDVTGKLENGNYAPEGFKRAFLILFGVSVVSVASSLFIKETMDKIDG